MIVRWLEQSTADLPADNEWLSSFEREQLDALRFAKRRADWRLGRWTAKHAVAASLNLHHGPLAGVEIRPAASGAPEVFLANQPAQVSISLSHRDGVAACAVAPAGVMLGCDLEIVEPRSDAFLADYFTPEEQRLMGALPGTYRAKILNLFWSAKESTLKALGVGLREDSRSVMVGQIDGLSWANQLSDIEERSFPRRPAASRWNPMRVIYTRGVLFHGWWQQDGPLLRTIVAFPPPEQPIVLAFDVSCC